MVRGPQPLHKDLASCLVGKRVSFGKSFRETLMGEMSYTWFRGKVLRLNPSQVMSVFLNASPRLLVRMKVFQFSLLIKVIEVLVHKFKAPMGKLTKK